MTEKEPDYQGYAEGDTVNYWNGIKEGEPSGTGKINELSLLGGHTEVAWIDTAKGCIAVTHLERVS